MDIFAIRPSNWASNCYLIVAEDSNQCRRAAVIDPSVPASTITALAKEKEASIDFIILTHGHFDHMMSADELRELTNAPLLVHENDAEMLSDGRKNAYAFFFGKDMTVKNADRLLNDHDTVLLGNEKIEIISTPGHSKGSICLLCGKDMITGDTLFADGYGRCDLWGGNYGTLKRSLELLREYDPSIKIYPGHGNSANLSFALDNTLYI